MINTGEHELHTTVYSCFGIVTSFVFNIWYIMCRNFIRTAQNYICLQIECKKLTFLCNISLIFFLFLWCCIENIQYEFLFGRIFGIGGSGSGGSTEKIEFRKSHQLHETIQRPAQPWTEKTVGEPIHGCLEPLRQRRWVRGNNKYNQLSFEKKHFSTGLCTWVIFLGFGFLRFLALEYKVK